MGGLGNSSLDDCTTGKTYFKDVEEQEGWLTCEIAYTKDRNSNSSLVSINITYCLITLLLDGDSIDKAFSSIDGSGKTTLLKTLMRIFIIMIVQCMKLC